MSSNSIMKLFYKVVAVYEKHDRRTKVSMPIDTLCTRIAERLVVVRKYALTSMEKRTPITPLDKWRPVRIVTAATQKAVLKCSTQTHVSKKPHESGYKNTVRIGNVIDAKRERASHYLLSSREPGSSRSIRDDHMEDHQSTRETRMASA